jgi:hypothetical protein
MVQSQFSPGLRDLLPDVADAMARLATSQLGEIEPSLVLAQSYNDSWRFAPVAFPPMAISPGAFRLLDGDFRGWGRRHGFDQTSRGGLVRGERLR